MLATPIMNRPMIQFASAAIALGATSHVALAQSLSVIPPNKYCWAENAGFINWADAGGPPGSQAPRFFSRASGGFFKGFAWCENTGWINLGAGAGPHTNTGANDFGVNATAAGALSGFAWGENIGWINFGGGALATPSRPARIDFVAGRLRGFAWSENFGWINLDDAGVFVSLGPGCPCDFNHDGLVEDLDFQIFLAAYNILDCTDSQMPPGCTADLNGDNVVEDLDFQIFLAAYNELLCP